MIISLKVKRLVIVGKDVGILLEDGTVLVQNDNDFVNINTGEVFQPVSDMSGYVVGFTSI